MKEQLLKKIIGKLMKGQLRTVKGQAFFEWMHTYALQALNYGSGFDISEDGELFFLTWLREKLTGQPNIQILDVGANVGKYANAIARVFAGEAFQVHAFEPSAFTYQKLVDNTSEVGEINTYPFGLSHETSEKELFYHVEGAGMASVYKRRLAHHGIEKEMREEIFLDTLDNWMQKEQKDQIDLLKMDVEGHELEVLKGAADTLKAGKIKAIQFEFGGCNLDSGTTFQDFFYALKDNYQLFRLMKDGMVPVHSYSEVLEIYLTTNYVAIHKENPWT
ncbi:MAG: FkbM family methyltransferase [Bacteroidota bacterium]